jgi:leucyl aminopeptidase
LLTTRFASAADREACAVGVRPGGGLAPTAQAADEGGMIGRVLARLPNFKGEEGDVLPICTPSGWLVLVGLGPEDGLDARRLRRIGGSLFAEVADSGIHHLAVALDLDAAQTAEVAFGMQLRAWRPAARYRKTPDPEKEWTLAKATLVTAEPARAEARFSRLAAIAAGAALARDLVVAPGNELNPATFLHALKPLERLGIAIDVLDPARHGLTLLQAVGQGSGMPPRLVLLRWPGGRRKAKPLAFIGKGMTFDAGGIDIKESEDMDEMKTDMAGAAAVVGALHALAARRAAVNAVGVLAVAENMPSGRSTRPGDVVRSRGGLTVEIVDTDAEGRLALADALAHCAAAFKPRLMVDLATLTGAVEVTLGYHRAGLFTADERLAAALLAAGEAEDEPLWRLPLTDAYDEAIKSEVADLRNCQWARGPDALHAARFLQHFVPADIPWAHLDIAGLVEAKEDGPLAAEGPTGFGVRLLDRLVADHYEDR